MILKWLIALMAITYTQVEAARILGLIWTFSRSHHIAGSTLLKELAKTGHEVHLLSTYNDNVDIPNFTQELLTGIIVPGDGMSNPNSSVFTMLFDFVPIMNKNVEKFWENEAVQKLIRTKPKYDAVIVLTFFNDFVLALPHYLKAPTIIYSSMSSNPINNKYVANPSLPYATGLAKNGFFARLNFVTLNVVIYVIEAYFLAPLQNRINEKYLPDVPPIEVLNKNVSLVLINSHYAIEGPRPYVPNMVQIGGFHTREVKKLPENLQTYLDSAKDGAILFSMGTNVKLSKNLQRNQLDAIMSGLGKVAPIKVLFKSEIDIPSAPENVLVSNWLPQNDILAHPNLKVFISHGGLAGTTEAVYHGVPMLGIPFFADQKFNIGSMSEVGLAVTLDVDRITEQTFYAALEELLTNPTYSTNAKKRSSLLKNQPVSSLQKAIWWIEHIIEYKGGEHLRNVGMELEWYHLYMVDVMAFFLALILVVLAISFIVIRWVLRILYNICRGKPKKEKKH
ncbi:hypothetical protein HHI36_003558 [Cryptolaemus montrouzieri]|uniref:UDP-glucuronosyltransferase n=1 Tax=Cryptolaemus montrouzieri TaxID=559131 RepID=A0ABD2PE86_9CUCU